jgi:hypothetical protein
MTEQTATEATGLDKCRRYLVPVARLELPGEPDVVHLSSEAWATGLALCGRSTRQGVLPVGTVVTCLACEAYRPTYEAVLDREGRRPNERPDVPRSPLKDLPDQVRAAVRESGLKQKWIADRLHMGEKHLSQMMTGRAELTPVWAERILNLCGMELVISVRPRSGVQR